MEEMRNFDNYVQESLEDPQDAAAYLEVALEEYEKDGNLEAFLLGIRDVVKANGGVSELANKTGLGRESLYKTLSGKRSPKLGTLQKIIHALGFKISVVPLKKKKAA